ncbi:MAG: hypothetical protein A2096_00595 [Spirochaetes bacterium GWF1_41_5]|nr:MAG: hypothetical protein A2096_00595 [Spirochaetes bacterium GWF1_41_5]
MKKIVIANQKGGVGKTTTTINLAYALAAKGKKILLLDLDPQGNTTSGLNISAKDKITTYDILINDEDINKSIIPCHQPGLSIIPANQNLSGARIEMVDLMAREYRLKNIIEKISSHFDFIFIDTPPSLDLLTLNGLTAADTVLIPIQCEYYALEGIAELLNTIKLVQKNLNRFLAIEGVLLTMYDSRTNLSKEVMESVVTHFREKTYKTIIPRNVKISEAPSHGLPISLYEPQSAGALAYEKTAEEFLKNNEY